MHSLSTNLIVTTSQNQIPVWGLPFSPQSYQVALTANTDYAVLIPAGMNVAIFSYSAGATISVSQDVLANVNTLPTGSISQTSARINPPVCAVTFKDDSGNALYLHCISPNSNDLLNIGFYFNGQIV